MALARSWRRLIPFIGYHQVLIAILCTAIITISIVVAGCTSGGLADVYLLSLSYVNRDDSVTVATHPEQVNPNISTVFSNIAKTSSLEIRTGYLGLCMRQNAGKWQCSGSATYLASLVKLSSASADDPLNLIWIASDFRNKIVFDGVIFIAIALSFITIILLSSFPRWHTETDESGSDREVKPFPSRSLSNLATALVALSSIFLFASILWQHIASAAAGSMVDSLSYGTARGSVGTVAMALGWTAVFCQLVALAGTSFMILSMWALNEILAE